MARGSRIIGLAACLAVLLAVLLAWAPGERARADHGGRPVGSVLACDRPVEPPRCTSVGNDRWHYVYIDPSVPAELAASLRDAMGLYSRTFLTVVEQPRITGATDAIASAGDWGQNGAAGWVYCPPDAPQGVNGHGDRWCQRQQIVFNLNDRYAVFFADDASRDHLACHELGHSLGLHHWGNPPRTDGPAGATCMNADTPNGPTDLHPTDRDHIDDYYDDRLALPLAPQPDASLRCLRVDAELRGRLLGDATPPGSLGGGWWSVGSPG